jgi:alkanesulfonate monooxygenase SsuD/methylene tetrahydromethanopterin reductase-like flavin-dependent oxidoreductase (luciferase family)
MVDHLSGGRARFEVGVGWLKDEFEILRVPWELRGRITDEYLTILRTLFETGGPFEGEFFQFPAVWFGPGPVQKPFPIYIAGGVARPALRRVAEFGRGWTPAISSFDAVEACMPRLDEALAERGRHRDEIDIQYRLDGVRGEVGERDDLVRQLERMRRAGVTAVCVNFADMKRTGDLKDVLRVAEWFAQSVMPVFAG